MSMSRWDPFGEVSSLRHAVDRLFEDTALRPGGGQGGQSGEAERTPAGVPLDVIEERDAILVRASLPGVRPEDVDLAVHRNTLTLRGQMQEETLREGRYHHRERRAGQFLRQVVLPVEVDSAAAEASFEHGVLTVRLPKSARAQTRRIPVRGSSSVEGERTIRPGEPPAAAAQSAGGSSAAPQPGQSQAGQTQSGQAQPSHPQAGQPQQGQAQQGHTQQS